MSDVFNEEALSKFQQFNTGNENSIANLGQDGLISKDEYSSANIFRWMRGSKTREANNAVRTELLKNLGEALGLSEYVKTNKEGKTCFTKEFITKLSDLTGDALKLKDFDINENTGLVSSGKPLTQRRITAILNTVANYKDNLKIANQAFDVKTYKSKLNFVLSDLNSLSTQKILKDLDLYEGEINEIKHCFKGVECIIKFLEKGVNNFVRNNPDYIYSKDVYDIDENIPKYQIFDDKKNDFVPLKTTEEIKNKLFPKLGSLLLHTENSEFAPLGMNYHAENYEKFEGKKPENLTAKERKALKNDDIKPMHEYIELYTKNFAKSVLDLYVDCKRQGKLKELFRLLASPGACIEGRTEYMDNFRMKHLSKLNSSDKDAIEGKTTKEEVEFAAKTAADANIGDNLSALIEKKLDDPNLKEDATWQDVREDFIKELVGKTRKMVTITKDGFTPVMQDNEQVERPVTVEDIDNLGKQIWDSLNG
ncbi:MAG: hypothetical protein K6F05_07590 [Succinivibrio sp.]|nr:hypothetical protein [Succinivibrio sp.]